MTVRAHDHESWCYDAARRIERAIRDLRALQDDGFSPDILLELALDGRPARAVGADEHAAIRQLYLDELKKFAASRKRRRAARSISIASEVRP